MERLCLDCEKPLIGRADKKFCDDACRSNYNNRLHAVDETTIKKVNQILKNNYKVLKKLNPSGKTKVLRKKMLHEGFSFEYFTNVYETGKGSQYRFCYEYGYLPLGEEEVLLVMRKDASQ
ncbi:hypothetical protein SAMN05216436_11186 [bacterium A37T11]|nr:hypothetical protein SAMN05216436_11186 [bacterium A37T11]